MSAILSSYYPIVEDDNVIADILVETMPDQVVRQKVSQRGVLSFYYGVETPKNPPFTLILKYDKLPLLPKSNLPPLSGKKKCYLSRFDDEPYVKDGDVYVFTPPQADFYYQEVKAYVKRFGHNAVPYFVKLPDSFYEECGEVIPTNPHAKIIVDVVNREFDKYIDVSQFEKEIYAFFKIF